MIVSVALFFTSIASGPSAMLRHQDEVRVERSGIRIRDVATLNVAAPSESSIGDIVIARMPPNSSSVTLQKNQIASLVRRALPMIEIKGSQAGSIRFETSRTSAKSSGIGACTEMLVSRARGDVLLADAVRGVACPQQPIINAVQFVGRLKSHVAIKPLAAGAIIPMIRFDQPASVRKGDRLTLVSAIGPVRIDRPVTALQAAHPGDHRMFVRTDEGQVFSVRTELQQGDRQ